MLRLHRLDYNMKLGYKRKVPKRILVYSTLGHKKVLIDDDWVILWDKFGRFYRFRRKFTHLAKNLLFKIKGWLRKCLIFNHARF